MQTVLAVDPGRDKCGLAVVNRGGVLLRAIVPTAEVGLTCRYLLAQHPQAQLIVGDSTHSQAVSAELGRVNPETPIAAVAEGFTTLEARGLYEHDSPPRGWRRLVPAGMRVPPRPVDDYAAVALAQRFLTQLS